MFSKRKPPSKPKSNTGRNLSQYGLFDIPDFDNVGQVEHMEDDDDADLEAELLALTGESNVAIRAKKVPVSLPAPDLDVMVAASLKDIPSDESISGDDDDPDLLNELSTITGEEDGGSQLPTPVSTVASPTSGSQVMMLQQRLAIYQEAEANAKAAGETARARRFSRGLQTLTELLKQASKGVMISEEDIPPEVSLKKSEPKPNPVFGLAEPEVPAGVPSRAAPPPPTSPQDAGLTGHSSPQLPEWQTPASPPPASMLPSSPRSQPTAPPQSPTDSEKLSATTNPPAILLPSFPETVALADAQAPINSAGQDTLDTLIARREEYKRVALAAKKSGNMDTAISYIKIAKQFDTVITGLEAGQPVDLSAMPPSPCTLPPHRPIIEASVQQSAEPEPAQLAELQAPEFVVAMPSTVLEALEQRLAKYQSQEEGAKAEGNSSKARRMNRIVKQYTDAIKQHNAGKPIPVDELPTPPGYPPIPVEGGVKSPQPSPTPFPPPTTVETVVPPPSSDTSPEKPNVRKIGGSRQERQLKQLLEKQAQFKIAALQAKQKGEVNQAKEYLRLAKGFDKLIEASNCGLPVDMNTIPVPPSSKVALQSDFDIVSAEECSPASPTDGACVLEKLERDLVEQMKKSVETRNHFKAIGDIASANRFEQQALHSKKDLDVVRVARRHNHPVPHFHYEARSFSIVQCNTDLGDNDLELTIDQGINYNVPNPKEVDTYVRFEFPWPPEEPYRDKTATVYNTNNPVYNEKFTLPIQRNVRACQRVFKRHAIKCEVWSKGCSLWFCSEGCCTSISSCFSSFRGFFRGDSLVGTAVIKLQPLETKCLLHESFDLMDGRKAVGGKLEVKVRLRNPIQTKQVERVEEKWLVIDR